MERILEVCLMIFCLLLIGLVSSTFAGPFAVADPQAADNYILEIWTPDMTTLVFNDTNVVPDPSGQYAFKYDLAPAALLDGSYTMRAKACNMWGCSPDWSVAHPFVKNVPNVLVGIKLVGE